MQAFTLFGGPLQRLGRRLGLVREGNTFSLGLALGGLAWGGLALLSLLQGVGGKFFSLSVIGVHVRFLVAVPLFFLCETWVGPRMAEFVLGLIRNGVVPEAARPLLAADIRCVGRIKDPWPAEVIFFLLAVAAPVINLFVPFLPGRSGDLSAMLADNQGTFGPVMAWYQLFCLPLFRFLVLRWLWHLGLWCYFLWRLQRLDLRLLPAHPDHAAGLGYLEVVQEHFCALIVAISAVYSASFAENLASGAMPFERLYLMVPLLALALAVLFVGPLLILSPRLWACRVTGWGEYMGMASRYVSAFDHKWIRGANPPGDVLLGTPDMQSLADLTNSVTVVRELQWVPGSRRLLLGFAASLLAPMLPLLLLKYPIGELTARLFQTLTGL
ncbi:MAG: hypothetical protein IT440_13335 [Phycisphaeraceae bacterium]|nr:hypothetical protein [Phycisphaeraceae bacterium]